MESKFADIFLYIGYVLVAIAIIITVFSAVVQLFQNPKRGLHTIMGLVLVVILVGIAYLTSSGEVTKVYAKFNVTPLESHWVGAGLISMYILVAISALSLIVSEIIGIFR